MRTQVSHIGGGFFTVWATKEAQNEIRNMKILYNPHNILRSWKLMFLWVLSSVQFSSVARSVASDSLRPHESRLGSSFTLIAAVSWFPSSLTVKLARGLWPQLAVGPVSSGYGEVSSPSLLPQLCPLILGSHRKGWDLGDHEKGLWPMPPSHLSQEHACQFSQCADSHQGRQGCEWWLHPRGWCLHREWHHPAGGPWTHDPWRGQGDWCHGEAGDPWRHRHQHPLPPDLHECHVRGRLLPWDQGNASGCWRCFLSDILCFWACSRLDSHEQGAPTVLLKEEIWPWKGPLWQLKQEILG